MNQTASLTLLKNVVNDNGGSAAASAWDLTATPATLAGLVLDGRRLRDGGCRQHRPGASRPRLHAHRVGRAGLRVLRLQQFVGGVWQDVVANPDPALYPQQDGAGNWQVTSPDSTPVYRFVNDDVAPILTLVKTVTNDNGGTALPNAWTLTATTPAAGAPDLSGTTAPQLSRRSRFRRASSTRSERPARRPTTGRA